MSIVILRPFLRVTTEANGAMTMPARNRLQEERVRGMGVMLVVG